MRRYRPFIKRMVKEVVLRPAEPVLEVIDAALAEGVESVDRADVRSLIIEAVSLLDERAAGALWLATFGACPVENGAEINALKAGRYPHDDWGQGKCRLRKQTRLFTSEITAQYTSQQCSSCGHIAQDKRKYQKCFCCGTCGHAENADINAAKNILAAGHAVMALVRHSGVGEDLKLRHFSSLERE